jgi:hypothetical protein
MLFFLPRTVIKAMVLAGLLAASDYHGTSTVYATTFDFAVRNLKVPLLHGRDQIKQRLGPQLFDDVIEQFKQQR